MGKAPFLAIVGLGTALDLGGRSLSQALAKFDTERAYQVTPMSHGKAAGKTALLVDVDGAQFTIVPRESVEVGSFNSAVLGAALNWREAASAVAQAKADVIVAANRPAADHAAAVKTAFLLTVIVEALLSRSEPAFVYWGTADMVVEPGAFSEAAKAMLAENEPPVLQWVRFELFPGEKVSGRLTGGMRSMGLAHFVGHELELQPAEFTPVEIARRAVGYAEQLVREGPSKATEVDGPSAAERIYLDMDRRGKIPVLRMKSSIRGREMAN